MQIIYEPGTEHIQINQKAVTQVLQENGVLDANIEALRIHIKEHQSEEQQRKSDEEAKTDSTRSGIVWGRQYPGKHLIDLYLCGRTSPSLNETLLHELNHEIHNGYQLGEENQPYRGRPSEVEARRFASEHTHKHRLVTIPGEVIHLSYEEFESKLLKVFAFELIVVACLVLNKVARSI